MEIFLSKLCESITGSLGQGFGFHIQKRSDSDGTIRFWGVRKSKGTIPPDGHLRFIFLCAELAQNKLHITDIEVSQKEIMKALHEMHRGDYLWQVSYPDILHANDVLSLKSKLGL